MCRSKHVEPSIDFGIINSITKIHLVGISSESSHGSMNINFVSFMEHTGTNNVMFRLPMFEQNGRNKKPFYFEN